MAKDILSKLPLAKLTREDVYSLVSFLILAWTAVQGFPVSRPDTVGLGSLLFILLALLLILMKVEPTFKKQRRRRKKIGLTLLASSIPTS